MNLDINENLVNDLALMIAKQCEANVTKVGMAMKAVDKRTDFSSPKALVMFLKDNDSHKLAVKLASKGGLVQFTLYGGKAIKEDLTFKVTGLPSVLLNMLGDMDDINCSYHLILALGGAVYNVMDADEDGEEGDDEVDSVEFEDVETFRMVVHTVALAALKATAICEGEIVDELVKKFTDNLDEQIDKVLEEVAEEKEVDDFCCCCGACSEEDDDDDAEDADEAKGKFKGSLIEALIEDAVESGMSRELADKLIGKVKDQNKELAKIGLDMDDVLKLIAKRHKARKED